LFVQENHSPWWNIESIIKFIESTAMAINNALLSLASWFQFFLLLCWRQPIGKNLNLTLTRDKTKIKYNFVKVDNVKSVNEKN